MVDGGDLVDAQQSFDQQTGEPDVTFRFNLRGGQKFGQVTTENVGRPFAIVLDSKVISAPVIRSPITGGTGQITGNFTSKRRAASRSCCAPAPCRPSSPSSRSAPSAPGSARIRSTPASARPTSAALLVVVYMIATYGIFGIFADLALGGAHPVHLRLDGRCSGRR